MAIRGLRREVTWIFDQIYTSNFTKKQRVTGNTSQLSSNMLCVVNSLFTESLRFSSVPKLCLSLCDPMDCSTPGFAVHHQLQELTHTHVHRVSDAIQPSHPLSSPSPPAFTLPASGSSPMSQFFTLGGQSIGVSASASVLPMSIQDWFPLGWIGWISLQCKGLSSLLQHHSSKSSILQCSAFFKVQLLHPYMTTGKNNDFD